MNLTTILEKFPEAELRIMTGYDQAIIGIDENRMLLIYSVKKIIEILTEEMPEQDALEFFDYNIAGSCNNDSYPILCFDI